VPVVVSEDPLLEAGDVWSLDEALEASVGGVEDIVVSGVVEKDPSVKVSYVSPREMGSGVVEFWLLASVLLDVDNPPLAIGVAGNLGLLDEAPKVVGVEVEGIFC
jgi:hypothetical protein